MSAYRDELLHVAVGALLAPDTEGIEGLLNSIDLTSLPAAEWACWKAASEAWLAGVRPLSAEAIVARLASAGRARYDVPAFLEAHRAFQRSEYAASGGLALLGMRLASQLRGSALAHELRQAADALEDGGEVSHVAASVAPALEAIAGPQNRRHSRAFNPQSLGTLAASADAAVTQRWLVDRFLGEDELVLVYGHGKVGKTSFLAALAAAVARGAQFLDRATKASNVLWCDNENARSRVVRKLLEAGCPANVYVHCGAPPPIDALRAFVLTNEIGLVVIDSLIGHVRPADENDASEMRALLTPLYELSHDTATTLIPVHHSRKTDGTHGDNMRGSSAIRDAVDAYVEFKRVQRASDETLRQIEYEGRNQDEVARHLVIGRLPVPPGISARSSAFTPRYAVAASPAQERQDRIAGVLETQGPLGCDEVAEAIHESETSVHGDLQLLLGAGRVRRSGSGRKGDPYVFEAVGRAA